jgi:hypothetical protein
MRRLFFLIILIACALPIPADAIPAGLKYGWRAHDDSDMSVRVEWYRQTGSVPGGQEIGNQVGWDNYPDLNALNVQFSYRFKR